MSAQTFGLDIGRSYIKAVQIHLSGTKKTLVAASKIQTPPGGMMSESPNDLKKLSESIKTCVSSTRISTDKCVISLIESQVVTRLIELPNLTDKELSSSIEWEAEHYLPLPIKDVNLQYQVIHRPTSEAGKKMQVLLVAAPKRIITKYINVVKDAGLSIDYMESEAFALNRALTKTDDPMTIIISLGATSTDLAITHRGNVLLTRSVATGGVNLTRAIMAEFNLPQDQAEQYKQTYGLSEDKLSGKVAGVLKPILDILISEILKAVEFSHQHSAGLSAVKRIIICGGGAFLPGLPQFLTERTSLEVSSGDAWADFKKEGLILKLPGQGSVYTVATGLALRS